MQLTWIPYTLRLKHAFTLASGSRTTTPVMLVKVEAEGIAGFGEASMPPYLGETQESVAAFLSMVRLRQPSSCDNLVDLLQSVDKLAGGNHAAKAAVDIALHDWLGKKMNAPWWRFWGLDREAIPPTSFTIGHDTPDIIRRKVREAGGFRILKVKLGMPDDRQTIEAVRAGTDVPLRVDANQGWKERDEAIQMIEWLCGKGVELVEQPMPREHWEDHAWLKARSPLPIVADEAVARLADIDAAAECYHGINIKLMKCTGMAEAYSMIRHARQCGLKVMLGCMTETSCAISAAAQLSPLADWVDLDGALLIENDPFRGSSMVSGRLLPLDQPGIGISPPDNSLVGKDRQLANGG